VLCRIPALEVILGRTMRLRVLSDLHLEFGPFEPPPCAADVVVLAGDIHTGTQALPWIQQHFPGMPVVLVLGNHEFYGHAAPALVEEFRAAVTGTNVHLLENAAVELAGWRFLGCTLWTDFCLHGAEHQVAPLRSLPAGLNARPGQPARIPTRTSRRFPARPRG